MVEEYSDAHDPAAHSHHPDTHFLLGYQENKSTYARSDDSRNTPLQLRGKPLLGTQEVPEQPEIRDAVLHDFRYFQHDLFGGQLHNEQARKGVPNSKQQANIQVDVPTRHRQLQPGLHTQTHRLPPALHRVANPLPSGDGATHAPQLHQIHDKRLKKPQVDI